MYSRPMAPNPMMGSQPPDRNALVSARVAGSGLPHFAYDPPDVLTMHDSEGNPMHDRPELSGQGGGGRRQVPAYPGSGTPTMPSYPAFPTPTFTYNLFPA
jgi:hypothetical protein